MVSAPRRWLKRETMFAGAIIIHIMKDSIRPLILEVNMLESLYLGQ